MKGNRNLKEASSIYFLYYFNIDQNYSVTKIGIYKSYDINQCKY